MSGHGKDETEGGQIHSGEEKGPPLKSGDEVLQIIKRELNSPRSFLRKMKGSATGLSRQRRRIFSEEGIS